MCFPNPEDRRLWSRTKHKSQTFCLTRNPNIPFLAFSCSLPRSTWIGFFQKNSQITKLINHREKVSNWCLHVNNIRSKTKPKKTYKSRPRGLLSRQGCRILLILINPCWREAIPINTARKNQFVYAAVGPPQFSSSGPYQFHSGPLSSLSRFGYILHITL